VYNYRVITVLKKKITVVGRYLMQKDQWLNNLINEKTSNAQPPKDWVECTTRVNIAKSIMFN